MVRDATDLESYRIHNDETLSGGEEEESEHNRDMPNALNL